MTGESGLEFRQTQILFLLHNVQTGCRTHSASCLMDTGGPSTEIKWPDREADNSPLSGVGIKTVELYLQSPIRTGQLYLYSIR
jgi:hypothetical protein